MLDDGVALVPVFVVVILLDLLLLKLVLFHHKLTSGEQEQFRQAKTLLVALSEHEQQVYGWKYSMNLMSV